MHAANRALGRRSGMIDLHDTAIADNWGELALTVKADDGASVIFDGRAFYHCNPGQGGPGNFHDAHSRPDTRALAINVSSCDSLSTAALAK